ncbi:MAG TPA: 16S rRNA (cytosine(1402)-N(4))-methyltransferase RsmH [bacterium]|nr:16S rRNA (cytosine(1402)-N(4))-methyltransferase RsmH [bacterium]
MPDYHIPVLLQSCIDFLQIRPDGFYVDGTLGGGGHSAFILQQNDSCRLFAFDMDRDAIKAAGIRLAEYGDRATLINDNFRHVRSALAARGITQINGILLDLGVSSHQLDWSDKGFSYRFEAPLTMAMADDTAFTARDVVNGYSEQELARIFFHYGEEQQSRRIARTIVQQRTTTPLQTTKDLADLIRRIIPERHANKTLSRIFQAIRIEVNDELNNLRQALADATGILAIGGRIVVMSYHSLEDRIVKDFFRDEAMDKILNEHYPELSEPKTPRLKVITKKPYEATDEEIQLNPRARSVKLRVAERI